MFATVPQKRLKMLLLVFLLSVPKSEAIAVIQNPSDMNLTFENWTTCKEFLKNSTLDEKSILDIDWRVFYMWNTQYEEPYTARFRLPPQTLIDRFRDEVKTKVDEDFSPRVNWNQSAFFMETTIDLSALYIRTNVPGIYQVVSSLVFQYNVDPNLIIALKLVEPGYLGFMNCKLKICIAFAPAYNMPRDDQLDIAAKTMKVRHPYGFPYVLKDVVPDVQNLIMEAHDDAEDEEEMEVEMQGGGSVFD